MTLENLEPKAIWRNFEKINAIPRASTKEATISKFMFEFGNSLGFESKIDAVGNVIIKKPGSLGNENSPSLVLQAHLDMVHQKEENVDFDFDTEGIQMYVEGDWVKANGTTLGADNGLGVATIMAVLCAINMEHPPIEALFTIDEEVGMTGAMGVKKVDLSAKRLLNLDSEEDDEITIGCAGGVDVEIKGKFELETLSESDFQLHEIRLEHLMGGHSGVDIHLNAANAAKVLAEDIDFLIQNLGCRLKSMELGTLTNVIPRNGKAFLAIPIANIRNLEAEIIKLESEHKNKFGATDKNLKLVHSLSSKSLQVMDLESQNSFISAMLQIPNGVYALTKGLEDLVETSNNVAVVRFLEKNYQILCHVRSSVDSERKLLVNKIKACYAFADVTEIGPYPGWKPNFQSALLAVARKCFEDLHGVSPQIKSIHAGLECGVLAGIFPEMEMISIGPNILGAHSPEERAQISSTQKFWVYLTDLLKRLS